MNEPGERVECDGVLYAIIIRASYREDGIRFFTPDSFSQQLAYMNRPQGYEIPPHVHNPVHRDVTNTLEALFIRSGTVRIDFYTQQKTFVTERVLTGGDVVLLCAGGHGFSMLEPCEIIEIKQGPYAGDADKTRFEPQRNTRS